MKKKTIVILLIIVSGVIGFIWYQNANLQKSVKVKADNLSELSYNAPTDYLLLLVPIDSDEKEGEEITYIAPITGLDAKPKLAYSTEGTYNYVYNNLYQANKNEFQLYDSEHQKLKTITFSDENSLYAQPKITEVSKKINAQHDQYITTTGHTIIIQKPDLYHEFDYMVKINDTTYQVYDVISMSNYYEVNS